MKRDVLKRMFAALTGEQITNARYVQLLNEYARCVDAPVEKAAVKLVNEVGVVYLSEGLVYEEVVVAM